MTLNENENENYLFKEQQRTFPFNFIFKLCIMNYELILNFFLNSLAFSSSDSINR